MGIRCLAGWAVAAAALAAPAAASAAPDTPDPGFGVDGVVRTGFPGRVAQAAGMILDRAGRPVVVAKTESTELGILRLGPDGALEPGFLGTRPLGVGVDSQLTELAEHGDGYVAGGWIETMAGAPRFALVRWDAGGAPDAAFGVVGDALDAGELAALAVDPAQRIVAVGRSGARIRVARYVGDGTRDAVFSRTHDFTGLVDEEASGVVVEPDGRVMLAGTAATVPGGERHFLLVALTASGAIDATFGLQGTVTLDVGDGMPAVRAMARQPDGKLVFAGTTDAGGAGGGVVARLLPDGSPDPTFSNDGIARVGVAGAIVEDVVVQPDGKIVAVGTIGDESFFARFRPGGVRDPGFGVDGVVRQALGPGGLTGVGVAGGGRIVGGGRAGGAIVASALTGGDTSEPGLAMTADGLGDLVTFTISATNRGADPAHDARVDVTPPPGLAARAITGPGGSCGGTSCALGVLPAGATARVTLLARAKAPGPLPASAVVSTSTFDADPGNNSASVTGTARRNRVVRRDRTKPVLKLRLPAKRLKQVRRFLRLRVTTSEPVSVRFTGRAKQVKTLVRSRRVALERKGKHRVTLKLTKAGRKAVKQASRKRKGKRKPRRLKVVVAARATDRAGHSSTAKVRKTMRR
jgi:uncharacterized delta-60 repeat protein/uncharacterized repeat protein (TIGR01451 family)